MFEIIGDTNFLRPVEIGADLRTAIRMVRVAVFIQSLRLLGDLYVLRHTQRL